MQNIRSKLLALFLLNCVFLTVSTSVHALTYYDYVKLGITPIPCKGAQDGAPVCPALPENFNDFYGSPTSDYPSVTGKTGPSFNKFRQDLVGRGLSGPSPAYDTGVTYCAKYFKRPDTAPPTDRGFTDDPANSHYWAEDPETTELGKGLDRARQFLYWTISRPAIDDAPVLKQIWGISRNIALSIIILVAALLGIWMIISRRVEYEVSGEFSFWKSIRKITLSLLYIVLSSALVLTFVQLSEIIMKFFIETLGGSQLFNNYFSAKSTESNYITFIGCRDLNIRAHESANMQSLVLVLTNISYYVMGLMILLRKILLWFLLFVSPFLPILLSFPLIRNTGKIWIGVFFQWLFYGPLLALFLGATAKIWETGIPFLFDFSRIHQAVGYVFPTALIITTGGPAQKGLLGAIGPLNSLNYIDTFVEYVVSLLMIWAVTFFPWWLLRIFRDYCCDGIYAMKNALVNFAESKKPDVPKVPPGSPPPPPKLVNTPQLTDTKTYQTHKIDISNIEQIKRSTTQDISTSLSFKATNIKDIAKLETNKETVKTVREQYKMMQNPLSAQTTNQRSAYLNLRTELYNRATSKNDTVAKYILAASQPASAAHAQMKSNLSSSIDVAKNTMFNAQSQTVLSTMAQSQRVQTQEIKNVATTLVNQLTKNQVAIENIANRVNTSTQTVTQVLNSYLTTLEKPISDLAHTIATQSKTTQEVVTNVLRQATQECASIVAATRIAQVTKVDDVKQKEILSQIESKATEVKATHDATTSASQVSATSQTNLQTSILSNAKVLEYTTKIVSLMSKNESFVTEVTKENQISKKQLESVITSIATTKDLGKEEFYDQVFATTGVTKPKVLSIIKSALQTAQKLKLQGAVDEATVRAMQMGQEQLETVASPQSNIDLFISVSQTADELDEYDSVRDLWIKQYQDGEVPVSDVIADRLSWVSADATLITNILNKILSNDPKLKSEALDEVGIILPIFMINNLSGSQLLTYLKAKLSAAKQVKKELEKQKMEDGTKEQSTEEFVDVLADKKEENTKHLEVDETGESREAKTE